jgi:hypothetical protein
MTHWRLLIVIILSVAGPLPRVGLAQDAQPPTLAADASSIPGLPTAVVPAVVSDHIDGDKFRSRPTARNTRST